MLAEKQVNKLINTVGVSTGILAVIIIAGLSFLAYQKWVETKLTKLQIKKICQELGIPDQSEFKIKIPDFIEAA